MPTMINMDSKSVLNKLDKRFERLEQKLDKFEGDLTNLKVDMAIVKTALRTVKEKHTDLLVSQRDQVLQLVYVDFILVFSIAVA